MPDGSKEMRLAQGVLGTVFLPKLEEAGVNASVALEQDAFGTCANDTAGCAGLLKGFLQLAIAAKKAYDFRYNSNYIFLYYFSI